MPYRTMTRLVIGANVTIGGKHMRRATLLGIVRVALVLVVSVLAGFDRFANAQTMVEYSAEARFQLDLHVPDAALMAFLPPGWTPNVSMRGPAKADRSEPQGPTALCTLWRQ